MQPINTSLTFQTLNVPIIKFEALVNCRHYERSRAVILQSIPRQNRTERIYAKAQTKRSQEVNRDVRRRFNRLEHMRDRERGATGGSPPPR